MDTNCPNDLGWMDTNYPDDLGWIDDMIVDDMMEDLGPGDDSSMVIHDMIEDLESGYDSSDAQPLVDHNLTLGSGEHQGIEPTNGTTDVEDRLQTQPRLPYHNLVEDVNDWLNVDEYPGLSAEELRDLARRLRFREAIEASLAAPDLDMNSQTQALRPDQDSNAWRDNQEVAAITHEDVSDIARLMHLREVEENTEDSESENPITTDPPTSIPAHFPPQISRIIQLTPFVKEGDEVHDVPTLIIHLINQAFSPNSPQQIELLQQFAQLLDPAPLIVYRSLAAMLCTFAIWCIVYPSGDDFTLDELARDTGASCGAHLYDFLNQVPDDVYERIFGIAVRGHHLIHLTEHAYVFIKPAPGVPFAMLLEPCEDRLYSPQPSHSEIITFVNSLQAVPTETLEGVDGECGVCREMYGAAVDGQAEVEVPVRLPCSHVFGNQCLGSLLARWQHNLCPLCRAGIPMPTSALGAFLRNA